MSSPSLSMLRTFPHQADDVVQPCEISVADMGRRLHETAVQGKARIGVDVNHLRLGALQPQVNPSIINLVQKRQRRRARAVRFVVWFPRARSERESNRCRVFPPARCPTWQHRSAHGLVPPHKLCNQLRASTIRGYLVAVPPLCYNFESAPWLRWLARNTHVLIPGF